MIEATRIETGSSAGLVEPLFRTDAGTLAQQLRMATQAHEAGRLDEALAAYFQLAAAWPDDADLHNNLGAALRGVGRFDASVAHHRRALALRPDDPLLLTNLGNALREAEQPGQALPYLQQAVALAPSLPQAHLDLGLCLRDLGRLPEAIATLEEAERLAPEPARMTMELGVTRLLAGDMEGFAQYEARRRLPELPPPEFRQPAWAGEGLAGRRILLYPEQGLTDALMFVRYAGALKLRGASVLVLCQAALADLLRTCADIDDVVREGDPLPAFDCHCAFASLPGLLGIEADPTRQTPYLSAPAASRLRIERSSGSALAVGLYWSAGGGRNADRRRSVPFAEMLALAGDHRLQLFGLQGGTRQQDIALSGAQGLVHDVGGAIFDFAEAAAALVQLDLLLAVDAPLAHLAGALGVPTWLLLPTTSDWRWGATGSRSLWYPSVRIYRQTIPGDWSAPLERIRQDVARLADIARQHQR